MKNTADFRVKLKSGRPVIGAWSVTGSPIMTDLLATAGLDFIIADFEHGAWTPSALQDGMSAADANGVSVLVRPPNVDQTITQAAFDLGAAGVIYPQISSGSEASRAVAMSRFAPKGTLGFNPFTRRFGFGKYGVAAGDNEFFRSIIIENPAAVKELDAILALKDLDAVYLGVYDMSVALGVPGQTDHVSIKSFVQDVSGRAKKAGKLVAMMARNEAQRKLAREVKADIIVCGVDSDIVRGAAEKMVADLR